MLCDVWLNSHVGDEDQTGAVWPVQSAAAVSSQGGSSIYETVESRLTQEASSPLLVQLVRLALRR